MNGVTGGELEPHVFTVYDDIVRSLLQSLLNIGIRRCGGPEQADGYPQIGIGQSGNIFGIEAYLYAYRCSFAGSRTEPRG